MGMTLFEIPNYGGKIVSANQNQIVSRFDRGKLDELADLKSRQPEISDSAWYHDAAVRDELVRSSSEKR